MLQSDLKLNVSTASSTMLNRDNPGGDTGGGLPTLHLSKNDTALPVKIGSSVSGEGEQSPQTCAL